MLFTGREWSELGSRDIDGCAGMGNLRSERARASQWLSELKLYDYRARLYNPELGRFMQPDPKDFAAGDYNLYRYCHNDPVNHTDPTGLVPDGYEGYEYRAMRGQSVIVALFGSTHGN
jgi:RHS repeat-associated protein